MGSNIVFKGQYNETGVEAGITHNLKNLLAGYENRVVILCVGTDSNIPDSLGPLVGTMLVESGTSLPVYGTLDSPIHATNLLGKIRAIKARHAGFLELGIDASLGKKEDLGLIELKSGGFYPGRALQKNLPQIGHVSILGKVEIYRGKPHIGSATEARLSMVYAMAQKIAQGLIQWEKETRS